MLQLAFAFLICKQLAVVLLIIEGEYGYFQMLTSSERLEYKERLQEVILKAFLHEPTACVRIGALKRCKQQRRVRDTQVLIDTHAMTIDVLLMRHCTLMPVTERFHRSGALAEELVNMIWDPQSIIIKQFSSEAPTFKVFTDVHLSEGDVQVMSDVPVVRWMETQEIKTNNCLFFPTQSQMFFFLCYPTRNNCI